MIVRSLLVLTFCLFLLSGTARADLAGFIAEVNAGYTGDIGSFSDQLAGRFLTPDDQLSMVVLAVDTPADAVISLWIEEQTRLPIDRILQQYQQLPSRDWQVILDRLGFASEPELARQLAGGEFGWNLQVAGFR